MLSVTTSNILDYVVLCLSGLYMYMLSESAVIQERFSRTSENQLVGRTSVSVSLCCRRLAHNLTPFYQHLWSAASAPSWNYEWNNCILINYRQ